MCIRLTGPFKQKHMHFAPDRWEFPLPVWLPDARGRWTSLWSQPPGRSNRSGINIKKLILGSCGRVNNPFTDTHSQPPSCPGSSSAPLCSGRPDTAWKSGSAASAHNTPWAPFAAPSCGWAPARPHGSSSSCDRRADSGTHLGSSTPRSRVERRSSLSSRRSWSPRTTASAGTVRVHFYS